MLLRFRVSNFLSFNETQELSMVAGKPRLKSNHVLQDRGVNILKFSAIYGANAAGKSNIIKAIRLSQDWIVRGMAGSINKCYCKINEENKNKPSTFEFDIKINDKYYSYGFSAILSDAQICDEWLFQMGINDDDETILIYTREYDKEKNSYKFNQNTDIFKDKSADTLNIYAEEISNNSSALFLTKFRESKLGICKRSPELKELFEVNFWFASILSIVTPHRGGFKEIINERITKLPLKMMSLEELSDIIKVLGLGINDVISKKMTSEEMKEHLISMNSIHQELLSIIKNTNTLTDIEEKRQKYNMLKAEIAQGKEDIEEHRRIVESQINEIKNYFNGSVPNIKEAQEKINNIENEIKELYSDKKVLETPNPNASAKESNASYNKYIEVIKNIESKEKEKRRTNCYINKWRILGPIDERIPNEERELQEKENELKLLQRQIESLESNSIVSSTEVQNTQKQNTYLLFMEDTIVRIIQKSNGELEIHKLEFGHGISNTTFGFDEESDGTQRIIELIDILWSAKYGAKRVFVVDEVDRSLHPDLTRNLVERFLDYVDKKSELQLIVTTHESRIMDLDLLRQDEIWFVNKNNEGVSTLYSLEQYDERYDRKIDKAYFEGRYGALPMFNVFFPVKKSDHALE